MGEKERISGHTQTIGLIGSPVEHSMSPGMHNAAFEKLGLDYVYLVYDVVPEQLATVVPAMTTMGFAGFNVTMPCKTHVLEFLDELSPAAELMGAVNTVVVKDGRSTGHNTDGAGFMRNLKEHGVDVIGKKITQVGAGGAGSAIFCQAALDGVAEIDVYNMKDDFFDATEKRVAEISEKTGCKIRLFDLADKEAMKQSVSESVLFINATRVGMAPMEDQSPLPAEFMHDGLALADTVYAPRETLLLKTGKERGLKIVPGLGMLLWQAAIGEKLWTGQEMPVSYIEEKFFS
ncbi:MAG: shikimate dehydrogenase [Raoultibacter sp.]|jgi:shikimate dehydrogenase